MATVSFSANSRQVRAAFFLLIFLILVAPIFFMVGGPIGDGIVAAISAGALTGAVAAIGPNATMHVSRLLRPIALVAGVPAIWMVIQILPLSVLGLSNPAWDSAGLALGHPIGGRISVDLGATLLSLCNYLSMASIMVTSIVVTSDRRRAKWILFVLIAGTTLIVVLGSVRDIVPFGQISDLDAAGAWTDCMALGLLLSTAALVRTADRYQSQGNNPRRVLMLDPAFVGCFWAFVICAAAILWQASENLICAVAFGFATLAALVVIRRFALRPWQSCAIWAIGILIAIAVLVFQPSPHNMESGVATSRARGSILLISQRILADTTWSGWGAGTFASLISVYRPAGDEVIATSASPSTAAAAIAIELGRPMLWGIVAAVIGGITILLSGALKRGRDSLYPAAGAGCLVSLFFLALGNSGVFGMPVMIFVVATLGLAFSQSKSRT